MPRIALTGGAYQAASLSAGRQRRVNLFPEDSPARSGEPNRVTHYPTPGLVTLVTLPTMPVRGIYAASNGDLYAVGGARLYCVSADWAATFIATLTTASGPVSMSDNTLTMVVVDGSARVNDPYSYAGGIRVDLATRTPQPMPIEDAGFYGSTRVDYLATFFLFNRPGTSIAYTSEGLSPHPASTNGDEFHPVDFSESDFGDDFRTSAMVIDFSGDAFIGKMGSQDRLVAAVATAGHVLMIGTHTSEPWALTIAPDLPTPFQPMGGAIIEHGCAAAASIAKADGTVFMLSQNRQGRGVVMQVAGGQAKRISTHAIEDALLGYDLAAARGYSYQVRGHTFYVLCFPVATWVYDLATEEWHQWMWLDDAGVERPHRSACFALAYGKLIVGDRETGALHELRLGADDAGRPIRRICSFPHVVDQGNRISYSRFIADMDAGAAGAVSLRYSDDRGRTFGTPLTQALNGSGSLTNLQFRRLGLARDRVFELSWDAPGIIAINGAFIEVQESET